MLIITFENALILKVFFAVIRKCRDFEVMDKIRKKFYGCIIALDVLIECAEHKQSSFHTRICLGEDCIVLAEAYPQLAFPGSSIIIAFSALTIADVTYRCTRQEIKQIVTASQKTNINITKEFGTHCRHDR